MLNPILKPILKSPNLPQLIEELQQIWNEEQERRQAFYDWVTPDMKAEFIEGEVIIHSPVRSKHNIAVKRLLAILETFVEKYDKGYVGVEKVMVRFPRNDYEPDLCFYKNYS